MEITQRIEQRQVISQRLQQSLKLLALNNLELETAIDREIETNPALEREAEAPAEQPAAADNSLLENIDWQTYFENTYGREAAPDGESFDPLANAPGPEVTLTAYLSSQLDVLVADGRTLEMAMEIVTALDADGYLRTPLAVLAAELAVGEDELADVLTNIVQRLDPPGVGARTLSECLHLQWQVGGGVPAAAGPLITDHLADIVRLDEAALARKVGGVSADEISEAIAFIKTLEPRPGRRFGGAPNPALVPDIRVEATAGGGIQLTSLDERVGRLYVSRHYRQFLSGAQALDEKTRAFLRDRIKAAAWFIRAVHERRRTVEKVARAIFERQQGFLTAGAPGLRPLTMEEVAADVGLHVSTVSRAVAGKVADTPRGAYPLKYFFTGALKTEGGEVSVKKVQAYLADIVADEDKENPLSDEEITSSLAAKGVRLARRTVAKYRREMKIPGKHERRTRI